MPTSYVFLAVGDNQSIHNQASYAITSVLSHTVVDNEVIVLTDFVENYDWFGSRVRCINIPLTLQQEWQGATSYFFRIKIKALQYVISQINNNHLVYLDADTVCLKNLHSLEQCLENGDFLMHTKEFPLHTGPTKTTRQMWRTGKGKLFGRYLINTQSMMWNSGVIGLPAGQEHYLQWALEACDAMSQSKMRQHFVEQFAVGLALEESNRLVEAKDWFLHYWGSKAKWQTQVVDPFVNRMVQLEGDVGEAISFFLEMKGE